MLKALFVVLLILVSAFIGFNLKPANDIQVNPECIVDKYGTVECPMTVDLEEVTTWK